MMSAATCIVNNSGASDLNHDHLCLCSFLNPMVGISFGVSIVRLLCLFS